MTASQSCFASMYGRSVVSRWRHAIVVGNYSSLDRPNVLVLLVNDVTERVKMQMGRRDGYYWLNLDGSGETLYRTKQQAAQLQDFAEYMKRPLVSNCKTSLTRTDWFLIIIIINLTTETNEREREISDLGIIWTHIFCRVLSSSILSSILCPYYFCANTA